jgi:N-acetylmuramoyl-L-alanine amidase
MRRLAVAAALALLAAGCADAAPATAPPAEPVLAGTAAAPGEIVGRSAEGLPIRAERIGSPRAQRVVLVVGEIHGTERAGRAVVRRLRALRPPRGTALLLVETANPDGGRARTRWNARGVDLNRNFPLGWRPGGVPFDTYHSGPGPLSEPESQAVAELIERVQPRVTVWYHQHMRLVDRSGGDPRLERLYARRSGLPYRPIAPLPGTATSWQNDRFPRDSAFVVELPAGPLDRAGARRHAGAVLALADAVAPPRIVRSPIPYGGVRRAEMAAYARRHYGFDDFRLRRPRVIVEHFTASNDFDSAFDTFAANAPDVEFGERPGVCAHYLIDRDGTVHQLVPDTLMCRHTVGLNWTAIGIEHVGVSDGQVLANRRQRAASLRLTRTLQGRHRIATRNVIGHAESLSSPFHRERVAAMRDRTHGDFSHATMGRYRRLLGRLPAPGSLR